VDAVLVVHVPHGERGVIFVPIRDAPDKAGGPLPVGSAARTVVLAGAGMKRDTLPRNGQALGMQTGEPGWG
jgi:hypothetical protein